MPYDSDGGFATGGGWIDAPLGAFPADPGLTGNAISGFGAKYRKGQQVPRGETQFQFNVAGLTIHSTATCDVLASRKDDPSQIAARNMDWSGFMAMLDRRQQYVVRSIAQGKSYIDQAAQPKVSPSAITQRRHTIAERARRFRGDEVLEDVQVLPLYRRQAGRR